MSRRVVEEKTCIKSYVPVQLLKITVHRLKKVISIFMFFILQIAASCWLHTLHWSRYLLGQSHTVCRFRHRFILLGAQICRSRSRSIHQRQMITHFLISVPFAAKINNNFYELCASCGMFAVSCIIGKNNLVHGG